MTEMPEQVAKIALTDAQLEPFAEAYARWLDEKSVKIYGITLSAGHRKKVKEDFIQRHKDPHE